MSGERVTRAPALSATHRQDVWAAVALGVLALALRLAILALWPFDGLYGQDAFSYYNYALGPLREALLNLQAPPPFFWPPGYPLFTALTALLIGVGPLAGQVVSLLAGSLAPVLTFALARELLGRGHVPLLAGLLVAVHPQLVQSSVVVMADTLSLAAATLAAWALAHYWREARLRWLAFSSLAMALAVLTRWAYALVAIPIAALAAWRLLSLARRRPGLALGQAGVALALAAAVLAPVLRGGVLPTDEGGAPFAGSLKVYSWNPANALRREFVSTDGLLQYRFPNGLYYALLPLHPYYLTPLLAIFLLPGGWAVIRRIRARQTSEAPSLLLLAWPVMIWGFHSGAPWQNFRFGLAALPPLTILAAIGIMEVKMWIERIEGQGGRGAGERGLAVLMGALGVAVAAGLGWMVVGGTRLTHALVERKNAELAVVAAVEAAAPEGADLITFNLTSTFKHYSRLETHELYYLEHDQLAALAEERPATLLVLNVDNVETQWQGHSPANNYQWLRDQVGLDLIATYPPYTLFQIRCQCP